MSNPPPSQAPVDRVYDADLAITFLTYYQALEQALVRAGYTQASCTRGTAQADWPSFARHIEAQFDIHASLEVQGAVSFLLHDESNLERRKKRLEKSYPWDTHDPYRDIVWISEMVQQTGHTLACGLNLPGEVVIDLTLVGAAFFIVQAWSHLDPQVESLLSYLD